MGCFRQEHWSGLPFPPPGDLPDPGIEPMSLELAVRFFTTEQGTQGCSVISFQPLKLQRECIQSFLGYHAVENLFFNPEDCWTAFFFFIADNSKLVWFHDINLGTYEVQRTLPCLDPKERNLYFLFSIFMKTVFFPFSWMMYTFNIPGGKCQWYASHNKRKSKEMQLQGTRNFIIFSVKYPEENLILKITGTLRRRQEYIERFVTLKINLTLNLSGSWAFFFYF